MNRGLTSSNLRRRHGSESEQFDTYLTKNSTHLETLDNNSKELFKMAPGSRDRTQEFFSIVRSIRDRGAVIPRPYPPPAHDLVRGSGDFTKIASSISRDIASTYSKLEKLTLLAKRKSLFDDRPAEIQELTFIIKEDMSALNSQIGKLQQIVRDQRSGGSRHQKSHSSSVVVSLQSKLADMTSHFKNVLEVRTQNLKESKSRQEKFSQGGLPTSNDFETVSLLSAMDDERKDDFAISMDGGVQSQALATKNNMDYLQTRADAMQNIESTIVELGGIFTQLAHMVKEQEEIMVRIDTNIDDTSMNVEAGHGELLKYFKSVTSNRWLMIKIFSVLIFFFLFFIIFMA